MSGAEVEALEARILTTLRDRLAGSEDEDEDGSENEDEGPATGPNGLPPAPLTPEESLVVYNTIVRHLETHVPPLSATPRWPELAAFRTWLDILTKLTNVANRVELTQHLEMPFTTAEHTLTTATRAVLVYLGQGALARLFVYDKAQRERVPILVPLGPALSDAYALYLHAREALVGPTESALVFAGARGRPWTRASEHVRAYLDAIPGLEGVVRRQHALRALMLNAFAWDSPYDVAQIERLGFLTRHTSRVIQDYYLPWGSHFHRTRDQYRALARHRAAPALDAARVRRAWTWCDRQFGLRPPAERKGEASARVAAWLVLAEKLRKGRTGDARTLDQKRRPPPPRRRRAAEPDYPRREQQWLRTHAAALRARRAFDVLVGLDTSPQGTALAWLDTAARRLRIFTWVPEDARHTLPSKAEDVPHSDAFGGAVHLEVAPTHFVEDWAALDAALAKRLRTLAAEASSARRALVAVEPPIRGRQRQAAAARWTEARAQVVQEVVAERDGWRTYSVGNLLVKQHWHRLAQQRLRDDAAGGTAALWSEAPFPDDQPRRFGLDKRHLDLAWQTLGLPSLGAYHDHPLSDAVDAGAIVSFLFAATRRQ